MREVPTWRGSANLAEDGPAGPAARPRSLRARRGARSKPGTPLSSDTFLHAPASPAHGKQIELLLFGCAKRCGARGRSSSWHLLRPHQRPPLRELRVARSSARRASGARMRGQPRTGASPARTLNRTLARRRAPAFACLRVLRAPALFRARAPAMLLHLVRLLVRARARILPHALVHG